MRTRVGRSRDREGGAALVEFAILAPLLILLLIGIVEFGWLFGQYNAVRHGAREGARFAAVNAGTDPAIRSTVCQAIENQSGGITELRVGLLGGGGAKGDDALIRVEADLGPGLTNLPLISGFLPNTLTSTVEFRLEQPSTWVGQLDAAPTDDIPDSMVTVTC